MDEKEVFEAIENEELNEDLLTNKENNEFENNDLEDTYKEMSPMRLVMRRFFRSKLSIVGLVMIVFVVFLSST